ncbi:MAG TPA: Holliday junction branch migration protein RuvA [Aliidongia sp.]|uniref:Holliday junction branch migration protein RuvA n=1 Tax=Aliidongia sp. TaxID=1914230 RepID=UPI002DDDB0BB|nr:Holliday junction branch migration protein RuvA [Aliidongia sp.]HEV2676620.1 Holliday junction branch migration protein RuvA [Aliidongia sp.]
MIVRLTGQVDDVGLDGVMLDVQGVGYLLMVSTRTRAELPSKGETASLLTEMQIREDHWSLFGFIDRAERDWFRTLTTVQGVGGRVALAILSVLSPDHLTRAILAQDKASLARADGVGPKLAARLVTELKDKAAAHGLAPAAPTGTVMALPPVPTNLAGPAEDAISALVNLGYRRPEALIAVATAQRKLGDGMTVTDLIRAGLKEIAS